MRSKEESEDYRYFPDPDLVPVIIDDDWIDDLKVQIPELALAKQRGLLLIMICHHMKQNF